MTPDKIYVPQHNIEAGTIQELDELVVEGSVEYIRKDALLEWASKENLKFNHIGNEQDDNFAKGIAAGLGYLISKLYTL